MPDGEFDASRPSPARIYDYLLGGKNNFASDREVAARLIEAYPDTPQLVRTNKVFLTRAVNWAARERIGQFLDLGSGIPSAPSVHDTARQVIPAARVVYADTDPVVISHVSALWSPDGVASAVAADLRDPGGTLAAAEKAGLDLAVPVCLLLGLVLHFMPAAQARDVCAGYISAIAPGSAVIASIGHGDEQTAGRVAEAYTAAELFNHSAEDFAEWLTGLDLVPPGICDARSWRAGWQRATVQSQGGTVLACVGRKPRLRRPDLHGDVTGLEPACAAQQRIR